MPRPLHRRDALLALPALLASATPASALLPLMGPRLPDPRDPATTLDDVEAEIARLLRVPEVTPASLAARLAAPGPAPVLFDVRSEEEFAMGRIAGATRLEPGASAATLHAHAARIAGAEVVVYCAVGWRSGLLLRRAARALAAARPASTSNLRGGLFRWRAEGLPVEGHVHPFDEAWGALLARTLAG